MTLLLLLTSSGGPKPVYAAIPATSDLTATADDRAAVSPVAEINVFSGGAATFESRAADQAAAVIAATADLAALLRNATDRAAEQITVLSDVVATLRSPTRRIDAQAMAVANLAAYATVKVPVTASALVHGFSAFYIRIPPRSLGGAASPAAGRATAGSLTGSGRGVTGTATSASGR